MKKVLSVILALCLASSMFSFAIASQADKDIDVTYREIKITLNGEKIVPVDASGHSVEPFVYNGTTYLPVRGVANALSLNVGWDADTSTVTLNSAGVAITPIEEAKASNVTLKKKISYRDVKIILNGKMLVPKGADGSIVEPFIMDGTTYLPVRAISEGLNLSVNWDNVTSTVILKSKAQDVAYKVLRVVDGDTIVVDFNGVEEKVRMIGIDTPESVHPDSEKNTAEGFTASAYTKTALEGKYVTLEFDVQQRDQYGRLLAYVYLNGVMFNKTLLETGYAVISTYPPNVKYVDEFKEIYNRVYEDVESVDSEDTTTVKTTGTYVGSTESDKYHNPSCRYAKKIAKTNQIWFDNKNEASSAGYSPCGVCKP